MFMYNACSSLSKTINVLFIFYLTNTFTTTNVNISIGNTLVEVCVVCELVFSDSGIGCYVVAKRYNSNFSTAFELMALNGSNFAAGCTEKLPCGLYQVMVFDLDLNGDISKHSVFTFENISITDIS